MSDEFSYFARYDPKKEQLPLSKALLAMPAQSYSVLEARLRSETSDVLEKVSVGEKEIYNVQIATAKTFAKQHLERMNKIKDLMKKFVQQKDDYIVQNTGTVVDHLMEYQERDLPSYVKKFCQNRFSQRPEQAAPTKETSLFDQVALAFKQSNKLTLQEAQERAATNDGYPTPPIKKEHSEMLKTFVNPYRQLYLWGSQEALDLRALLDCIEQIEALESKRRKMMKQVNWTQDTINAYRPQQTSSAQNIFEAPSDIDRGSESKKPQTATAFQTQKDIIHLVEINEYLIQFLAKQFLPSFREEKALQYRLILREYARQEIKNQKATHQMWTKIQDHNSKAQQNAA